MAPSHLLFAAVLEQSQDCIKLLSPDGVLKFMNANGMKSLAIDNFQKVAESPWVNLWPTSGQPQIEAAIVETIGGGKPRFQAFCPTAEGEPRWWDVSMSPIRDDGGDIKFILVTSRDITTLYEDSVADREARERAERMAEISDVIAAEMGHRLKNLLAVVASIATITARGRTTMEGYLENFLSRVGAFGESQSLLADRGGKPLSLAGAALPLLRACDAGSQLRWSDIPDGDLEPSSVQTLALVINELVTNARKHGALSDLSGYVDVVFRREGRRVLIDWKETMTVPLDGVPTSKGSGLTLIERMCRSTRNGISIEWAAKGIHVAFSVRLTEV